MIIKELPLDSIRTDLKTQKRLETNEDTVEEYTESLERGDTFPPIVVFLVGVVYVLVDGFHRYAAYLRLKRDTIPCEIIEGTIEDAHEYACSANTKHGLARTPEDKRKAAEEFFKIPGRDELSNSAIAKKLGVSTPFVKKIRDELGITPSPDAHHGKGSEKYQERLNDLISNASEEETGLNVSTPEAPQDGDKTINVELPVGQPHDFALALLAHFEPKYLKTCTQYLVKTFKDLT